jgi:hypothetical protein
VELIGKFVCGIKASIENKKPMKSISKVAGLTALLSLAFLSSRAQENEQVMMKQMENDNQATVDAIAMYPADTRRDILEAAKYPEVIVRLTAMQKQSKDQFADLLAPFSREEQEKIWDLTRHPVLISELVYDHRKSRAELSEIASRYPADIRNTAIEEGERNYDLLIQIDQNNISYLGNLDKLLLVYPRVTANAYRNLIKQPEILTTLYDNMQMTVVLGDIYKTDPQYVLFETDSLNQAITQQNAQGAQDWQQSLAQDPEAQQEYTQAAEDYAQESGYQSNEYQGEMAPDVLNYNTYPYNWWFGYPTWYATPCWDPYPFWYDWGFYYGPGGRPVFFGMPSSHFMNWYFYNPEHCSRYSAFGNHCYGYYTNHREGRYSNPVSRGVNDWRRRNKDVVTKDWDKDNNAGRAQRFKEYGQLESNRAKYNHSNPEHPLERKDYLAKNQTAYPHTTAVAVVSKSGKGSAYERNAPQQQAPSLAPHVKIPDSYYKNQHTDHPSGVDRNNGQQNSNTPKETGRNGSNNRQTPVAEPHPNTSGERPNYGPAHNTPPPARPITNENRSANEYHQNTWQEVHPQQQQQHYQSQPARSEPASRPSNQSPSGGGGKRK